MIIQHRGFILRAAAGRRVDPLLALIWIGIPAAGWILVGLILYWVLS